MNESGLIFEEVDVGREGDHLTYFIVPHDGEVISGDIRRDIKSERNNKKSKVQIQFGARVILE